MARPFEKVYTMTDWYDGPRSGVADFDGKPHLYMSEWDDRADDYASTFVLSPISPEVFQLALEDWATWRRWETAFHEGRATLDTHPALPEDRARHEQLKPILEERLVIDPARQLRARGEFRAAADPNWSGMGFRPIEVRWEP